MEVFLAAFAMACTNSGIEDDYTNLIDAIDLSKIKKTSSLQEVQEWVKVLSLLQ